QPLPAVELEAQVSEDEPYDLGSRDWSDAWMLGEAERYLEDATFRREVLERSLTNPDNVYSRARLSAYGRDHRGWDALPVWVPSTRPVGPDVLAALARSSTLPPFEDATLIWDGTRPTTTAQWVALGRRVFFDYPLRPEVFAEHALAVPAIAGEAGLG